MDPMLTAHGTTLYRLKPVNVLQAAQADVDLRQRKRDGKADREAPYSFMRQHVQQARSAAQLISIAYFSQAPATTKVSTFLLYSDRSLLRRTLIELLEHVTDDGPLRHSDVPDQEGDTGGDEAAQAHHGAHEEAEDPKPAQAGDQEDAFGLGTGVRQQDRQNIEEL